MKVVHQTPRGWKTAAQTPAGAETVAHGFLDIGNAGAAITADDPDAVHVAVDDLLNDNLPILGVTVQVHRKFAGNERDRLALHAREAEADRKPPRGTPRIVHSMPVRNSNDRSIAHASGAICEL